MLEGRGLASYGGVLVLHCLRYIIMPTHDWKDEGEREQRNGSVALATV